MRLSRMVLVVLVVGVLVGVAYVEQATAPAGTKMATAAEKFVDSLGAEQKTKATFSFDDKERLNWYFTPRQDKDRKSTRKGLPLEDMNKDQRAAALALLKAGTSESGYEKATTIMALESILADLEKNGAMVRNSDWYFFTVFGTPSKTGKWGWRVEGHHLSLNFTIDKGKIVSSTPAFFGSNPAVLMAGPKKGQANLGDAEDLAKELFRSLDDDQKKVALQKEQFAEIQENAKLPTMGEPKGVAYAKMTDKQRTLLDKLLRAYADRMPPDVAENELARVKEAGIEKVHFAFAGGLDQGEAHTYRIQGPSFVIEFLNVQADSAKNPANHIHSAWRSLKNDFGLAEVQ
jgi:Protein of unknown function (DUF3500)